MFDIDKILNEFGDEAPSGQTAAPSQVQPQAQVPQPQPQPQPEKPRPLPQRLPQSEKPRPQPQPEKPGGADVPDTMTGIFGGGSSGGEKPSRKKSDVSIRGGDFGAQFRAFLTRLPENWGVDLALILITVIGIVSIITNWNLILAAIAGLIVRLVRGVIGILFLIASAAALILLLRRLWRRRFLF